MSALYSVGQVRRYTSVAIGVDGRGSISYYDGPSGDLSSLTATTSPARAPTKSMLDSAGAVGDYTSMTLGADGLGLISYPTPRTAT